MGLIRFQQRYLSSRRSRKAQCGSELEHTPRAENLAGLSQQNLRVLATGWLHPQRHYDEEECFVPLPKLTFIVDQPRSLRCQICQETQLEVLSDQETLGDSTPSMLPCGHVAGAACLHQYFKRADSKNCPFCRTQLIHNGCGHEVAERLVTRESIHLIPSTIPAGGEIPDYCMDCTKRRFERDARIRLPLIKREFIDARQRYHLSMSVADAIILLEKQEQLETYMLEQHIKQMTEWLRNW